MDRPMQKQRGLSLGKVAEYCGVTRKTILRWVQDGLLRGFTLPSGHHRVQPEEVARFLRSHGMPVPPELNASGRKRALIADDDRNIRRLMVDLLKPHFDVVEAVNGVEACIRLGAKPPDLLVLDVKMPRMDGVAVCHQISSEDALKDLKVLVVSAHLGDEVRSALEGYADAILSKPFSPIEFIENCLGLVGMDLASLEGPDDRGAFGFRT